MTLIPNHQEKQCFAPCDQSTIDAGLCDCYNRSRNEVFSQKQAESFANDLFNSHYMILFDEETDKGEEILVSILSIKHSLLTVDCLIKQAEKYNHLEEIERLNRVKTIIEKI